MQPMKPMTPMKPMEPMQPMHETEKWWPEDLGSPSSTGSQNGSSYAVFPAKARLVVEQDGQTTTYDTGAHKIGGVAQQQSSSRSLAFTSGSGTVGLRDFEKL